MPTPYNPGEYPPREYGQHAYNPVQEARWQAYNTAYYALYDGALGSLHPTPGFSYNPKEFETWRTKFLQGGEVESKGRGKNITRGLEQEDYPQHVWLWLYQRMLAAKEAICQ